MVLAVSWVILLALSTEKISHLPYSICQVTQLLILLPLSTIKANKIWLEGPSYYNFQAGYSTSSSFSTS